MKYVDPDGEQMALNPFDVFGQMIQKSNKPLDKIFGLLFSIVGHNKAAEQQMSQMGPQMMQAMSEMAGEATVTGMQFMSDNGSMVAIAAYASGNVGLGLIIDGVALSCDITLAVNEYKKTGDTSKFVTSLTTIVATNIIGSTAGKAAKTAAGLEKSELMKKLEPMIADSVSAGIDNIVNFIGDLLND